MTVTVAVPVSPHAIVSTIAHWWQARVLELETKVHPKVRNHGEGPY